MTRKAEKEKNKESNKTPVYSKRLGAVSATVFENRSEDRTYFNVQVTRRYKASDGVWHDSNVFNGESDITHLIEVLKCTNRFLQAAVETMDEE